MIIIAGYTAADKVPGAVAVNQWGAGRQSIGAIALLCTIMGTMNTTDGDATPDTDRIAIFSDEDAEARFGGRSELANMAYAALEIPGTTLVAVPVSAPEGAEAATATITFGGSWSESGELALQLDHEKIRVAIGSTQGVDDVGAAVEDAVNQAYGGRLFCSAAYDTGTNVLTLTVDSEGLRGNQHTLWLDTSALPTGCTATGAGGTALANGGIPFSGGSGTDDVDDALSTMEPTQNDYIAAAHNDSTNVGKIEVKVNAKAAFDVGLLEQYVVSTNTTLSAAISLAQTTMNDQLGMMFWVQYGVEHPSRMASRVAALRSTIEGKNPNYNYDDAELTGSAPQFRPADVPNRATKNAALNAGVTPGVMKDDTIVIVRAITSRSLNGTTPDYRTLDVGEASVPIRVRKELVAVYDEMKQLNPNAGPDAGNDPPPEGVFTPNLWKSRVTAELQTWSKAPYNWLTEVDENPPEAEWDYDAKRVMSIVDTVVKPLNHGIGIIVRQRAA